MPIPHLSWAVLGCSSQFDLGLQLWDKNPPSGNKQKGRRLEKECLCVVVIFMVLALRLFKFFLIFATLSPACDCWMTFVGVAAIPASQAISQGKFWGRFQRVPSAPALPLHVSRCHASTVGRLGLACCRLSSAANGALMMKCRKTYINIYIYIKYIQIYTQGTNYLNLFLWWWKVPFFSNVCDFERSFAI